MKNILITAVILGIAALLWSRQQGELRTIAEENVRLAASAAELRERSAKADSAGQAAQQKFTGLRQELRSTIVVPANSEEARSTAPIAPDPAHQGGWPGGAGYFYLPKQFLTNVNYRLLDGDRVTDEAAALLGLSPAERESVNRSFGDLLSKYRLLEIERMQEVPPPAGWLNNPDGPNQSAIKFDSALVYKVPDLSADMTAAQTGLTQQLQQILGNSRAQIIQSATDSYLRQNLDDLGAGERTVGFVWQPESDGTKSLWYALADARNGLGSFQRVPDNVDPNSPTAYYARLMGVKLPGQN